MRLVSCYYNRSPEYINSISIDLHGQILKELGSARQVLAERLRMKIDRYHNVELN